MQISLTEKEAAAAAFFISVALEDEQPSDVRAAATRALGKLRAAGASDYDSVQARKDAPALREP